MVPSLLVVTVCGGRVEGSSRSFSTSSAQSGRLRECQRMSEKVFMVERGKEIIYLAILDIIRVGYNCRFRWTRVDGQNFDRTWCGESTLARLRATRIL